MQLYAVAIALPGVDDCIIQFYWADDRDHAAEQAFASSPEHDVVAIGQVPTGYVVRPPRMNVTIAGPEGT